MQKLIITTDAVGCREVIEDGITGFTVPIKNPELLAEAMLKVMALPLEQRITMGKAGREKIIREFSEAKVIESYLNYLIL